MALSAKGFQGFIKSWREHGMVNFLRDVGGASPKDIAQIFRNVTRRADMKAFQEGTGRPWMRDAFVNHEANFGNMTSNKTTEEWLNFGRGAGFFDNADNVYENLSKLKGLTPVSKEEARLRFSNAGSQITPGQLAVKNGFSITDDGLRSRKPVSEEDIERMKGYFGHGTAALKEREAAEKAKIVQDNARDRALRTTVRREVNSYEDELRNSSDFKKAIEARDDKERKVAANIAEVDRLTEKMNAIRSNPLRQDPMAMRVARENNIDIDTPEGRKFISDAMQGKTGQQLWAEKQQAALRTGSGKSVQESAVPKETWSDAEKSYGIKDLDFNGKGGPSIDEAILRQKIGGDRNNWGFKKAADRRFKNVMEQVQQDHEAIIKSNMSQEEKQALWTQKRKEATDLLAEGPNMADYAFGNNLQYKGIGFAAMIGAMNVAFGGAKSNAQLYSSPF